MSRAVVFAYHNVGVRCLSVLLAHGVDVGLVLTHADDPGENLWFDSVAELAARRRLRCATPDDPNTAEWLDAVRALEPDFIFSFYYRRMLLPEMLACARRGAYNMHGSLLPKYRGRAPVNWAVIRGERLTGATLHAMVKKPDAGAIAAQQAVPILPDDTAHDVFQKVTVAAELALNEALPRIVDGTLVLREQDLSQGSYFGGRTPADGRINWSRPATEIHNLIRGVAPPYPGAFTDVQGKTLRLLRSRVLPGVHARHPPPCLYWDSGSLRADCSDGRSLEILVAELDGRALTAADWLKAFGKSPVQQR